MRICRHTTALPVTETLIGWVNDYTMRRLHNIQLQPRSERLTNMTQLFIQEFAAMQKQTLKIAQDHGFNLEQPVNDERHLLLITGEVSEATEALRRPEMEQDKHIPEFTELEAELADVVLRTMNYAESKGLRLAEAIVAKSAYNTQRPFKHGG